MDGLLGWLMLRGVLLGLWMGNAAMEKGLGGACLGGCCLGGVWSGAGWVSSSAQD